MGEDDDVLRIDLRQETIGGASPSRFDKMLRFMEVVAIPFSVVVVAGAFGFASTKLKEANVAEATSVARIRAITDFAAAADTQSRADPIFVATMASIGEESTPLLALLLRLDETKGPARRSAENGLIVLLQTGDQSSQRRVTSAVLSVLHDRESRHEALLSALRVLEEAPHELFVKLNRSRCLDAELADQARLSELQRRFESLLKDEPCVTP